MRFSELSRRTLAAAVLLVLSLGVAAQTPAPQANRILPQPDLTRTTRLSGHLPAWVNPTTDTGPVPDDTPVRLTLLLSRTPALQAAFEQLLADQQNPSSTSYHQWLTPTQIGEQFGPTPDDVAAITAWLTASGLHLAGVSPSRTFLTVNGTADVAASTFAVTFHRFTYNGRPQLSATTEPTIPLAFASVIASIEGLTDLPLHPMHTLKPAAIPLDPLGNSTSGIHYLFPGDFARIYDVAATTNAGYDGTGSRVAIIGLSRITTSDVTELQAIAGLTQKAPNTIVIPTSADPGILPTNATNDLQGEALLDVTRVLATAPGAQADLVIATNAAGGIGAAMQYNVNTLIDPIMTISFGACESTAGASAVAFYDSLFAQGAAEGISTFISSGDAAAAGCSANFSTPTGKEVLAIGNFLCASSYATCVGGTEFADAGKDATYWSPTNSSTYVSALGYIPEGAWNEPTNTKANGTVVFQIAGSGSGPSAFITKPVWQTGTGVPADGARDTPDLSFSSAQHDGYFTCYAAAGGDCNAGAGIIFSGTSAAAPSMAAVTALLRQRLNKAQGNLNPLLYKLAASAPSAFHDATPASSGVSPCALTTASLCNNSVASPTSISGGLPGYPLQVGYDLVTGLGSLDVTNFLNAAVANATTALSPTTTTVTATPSFIQVNGTAVFSAIVTTSGLAAPTGSVQFQANSSNLGPPVNIVNGTATTQGIAFPTPGSYLISASYSGDANTASSNAIAALPFVVASGSPTTTSLTVGPNPATFASTPITLSVTVAANSGSVTPTGQINFYIDGLNGQYAPLVGGKATLTTPIALLGTIPITAIYAGDATFASSVSTVNLVVTSQPTATSLSVSPATITVGQTTTLSATAVISPSGSVTTGSFTFYTGSTSLGPSIPARGTTASATYSFATAGMYPITAVYSGDPIYGLAGSSSAATILTVAPSLVASSLTVAASPSTLTVSSAAANTATSTITASTSASFTGSVALACAVTPTTGAPPTCSLSATTLTFASAQSASSTLTLATITPHDHPAPGTLARHTPLFNSLRGLSLAALFLALIPAARRRRFHSGLPRPLAMLPLTVLLGATLLTLSGCGSSTSGGGSTPPPAPVLTGTTAGAYVVTVTATSGSTVTTSTVNLTVQ